MSDKTELLPCLHCGFDHPYENDCSKGKCVRCSKCGARSGYRETFDEAIKAWNTRATPTGTIITNKIVPPRSSAYYYHKWQVLKAKMDNIKPYMKDGETPLECIKRNRGDASSALALLAKEKLRTEKERE